MSEEEEREESAAGKGGEADARKKGAKRKGVWGKPSESRHQRQRIPAPQGNERGKDRRQASARERKNAQRIPARQGI